MFYLSCIVALIHTRRYISSKNCTQSSFINGTLLCSFHHYVIPPSCFNMCFWFILQNENNYIVLLFRLLACSTGWIVFCQSLIYYLVCTKEVKLQLIQQVPSSPRNICQGSAAMAHRESIATHHTIWSISVQVGCKGYLKNKGYNSNT